MPSACRVHAEGMASAWRVHAQCICVALVPLSLYFRHWPVRRRATCSGTITLPHGLVRAPVHGSDHIKQPLLLPLPPSLASELVMAHIVMAHMAMAYTVVAYVVMAYIVMAQVRQPLL